MSFAALALRLSRIGAVMGRAQQRGLDEAGRIVEVEARGMLGDYQPAIPPFPRWADLKDSTIRDRLRRGFTANDPLLRSGELRDSIHHEVRGNTAFVFSRDINAGRHEFGTSKMPPRPFIGPALVRKLDEAGKAVADHIAAPLTNGRR
ncbi:hypothetical protein EAH89_26245 [Roseomonas nepalensis]|uniref:Phage virion morphogenesis protein n=2 Tax=Muricoccus nepalensis TaxID=1854500 RepID=A0A502F8J4_9PROT|nr:hypothetical protein EAH89_26245 [Roseomonas nepalensis]